MQVSAARLEANRRNAAKSSGPKTAEGKLASRANALKHGMTGSVVLSGGDAEEVARRAEAMQAELRPSGEVGQVLVRRLALLSVRMERCAAHEAAALVVRVRRASADFDDRRAAEVEAAFASLPVDPAAGHRILGRMPEGVDRLIDAWRGLLADLAVPDRRRWDASRAKWVDALLGRSPTGPALSRSSGLARALGGDFTGLPPHEVPGETTGDRWLRCIDELTALIEAEVARLRDHRQTLDLGAIELDRAEAPALALFDPSAEATLARKYEAAAERGFFRALRELRQAEPEPAEATTPPLEAPTPLGSFPAEPGRLPALTSPAPAEPEIPPRIADPGPSVSSFVPFSIGKRAPEAG